MVDMHGFAAVVDVTRQGRLVNYTFKAWKTCAKWGSKLDAPASIGRRVGWLSNSQVMT